MKWCEPHENRQKSTRILDPIGSDRIGSRVLKDLQDLGHFSRSFGLLKDRVESYVKGDINEISYNRKKKISENEEKMTEKMIPYFGHDLESRKKVVRILTQVWLNLVLFQALCIAVVQLAVKQLLIFTEGIEVKCPASTRTTLSGRADSALPHLDFLDSSKAQNAAQNFQYIVRHQFDVFYHFLIINIWKFLDKITL